MLFNVVQMDQLLFNHSHDYGLTNFLCLFEKKVSKIRSIRMGTLKFHFHFFH